MIRPAMIGLCVLVAAGLLVGCRDDAMTEERVRQIAQEEIRLQQRQEIRQHVALLQWREASRQNSTPDALGWPSPEEAVAAAHAWLLDSDVAVTRMAWQSNAELRATSSAPVDTP